MKGIILAPHILNQNPSRPKWVAQTSPPCGIMGETPMPQLPPTGEALCQTIRSEINSPLRMLSSQVQNAGQFRICQGLDPSEACRRVAQILDLWCPRSRAAGRFRIEPWQTVHRNNSSCERYNRQIDHGRH